MVEDVPVRRRDAAATKTALLRAAQELFAERGFEQATVREIAARAGVNQALLFRYFGSKDTLFYTAMTSKGQELLATTSPEQLVVRMLQRLLASDARKPDQHPIYAILRSSAHERTSAALWEKLGAAYGQTLASLTAAQDGELRADLVLAWIMGIGLLRSVMGKQPLASADSHVVSEYVLRAVATLLESVDQRPTDD
jgi:AcrR family transcriptional regulator